MGRSIPLTTYDCPREGGDPLSQAEQIKFGEFGARLRTRFRGTRVTEIRLSPMAAQHGRIAKLGSNQRVALDLTVSFRIGSKAEQNEEPCVVTVTSSEYPEVYVPTEESMEQQVTLAIVRVRDKVTGAARKHAKPWNDLKADMAQVATA